MKYIYDNIWRINKYTIAKNNTAFYLIIYFPNYLATVGCRKEQPNKFPL
jgi:hypothetical protein